MNKKLRACILVPNEFVYDNATFYRAKTILSGGYEVIIVALLDPKRELPNYEKRHRLPIVRVDIVTRRAPFLVKIKPLRYIEGLARIVPILISQRADILHACGLDMLFAAVIVSKITKSKIVFDAKEFYTGIRPIRTLKDKILLFLFFIFERSLIKKADKVTTSSDSIALALEKKYGIGLPITILECKPYSRIEGSNKIREVLNISSDKRVILYFGNIYRKRGLDKLVESASFLGNHVIVIIGEGEYKKPLIEMVDRFNLSEKVKFLNKIPFEEIPMYISSADIGVTPFPNNCFNSSYNVDNRFFYYLSCGIPIASSNTFERRRLIEKYGIGVVFDATSPKDVAKTINNFLEDEALYKKVKQKVMETARTSLNLQNESKKLLAMYRNLLDV